MDLSTRYLGLALRNPLVASASPLSKTVDGVRRLADAGVGAVVLYSLFEEQLRREAEENARLAVAGTESFAESLSYFPPAAADDHGPRRYLSLLERAAAAVSVPVIGSINGSTPGGWADYARSMQDSGAAAIDADGKFAGVALLKPVVVAGPPNAVPAAQATLVPADTVREFLKANGVTAADGSSDAKASVVRVICVRK